jgi:hypothetical protein
VLLLVSTSDKLQVATSSAADTDTQASYVDYASGVITPGRLNKAIASATTTDVVAAPAASTQRNVKHLSIRNKHASTNQDVTVRHTDGTTIVELFKCTLAPGEELVFNDGTGFMAFDSSGALKTAQTDVGSSKLSSILLVAASSITFQLPSGNYNHLRLIFQGRTAAAVIAAGVNVRFNSDTGANYDHNYMTTVGTTTPAMTDAAGQTSAVIGAVPGASATANFAGLVELRIPLFSGTTFYKNAFARSMWYDGTNRNQRWSSIAWLNTAAITAVGIFSSNGNWLVGSGALCVLE